MTDHLESARTALSIFEREPSTQSEHRLADALAAILSHLESLGKPPTSELDELRGRVAAEEKLSDQISAERDDFHNRIGRELGLIREGRTFEMDMIAESDCIERASQLAASEQAREGMRAMNRWTRCLTPFHALHPEHVCDKPLKSWADGSWRCPDGHYNSNDTLVREGLGRLVRDVWVVWARDQDNPKPHHLLPWDDLGQADREVDRRIGETLLGIRDWRVGQTLQKPALDDLAGPPAKEEAKPQSHILRCCRGCGAILQTENLTMADGCPCNSARGVNHGMVPTDVCTCDACDPQQSGSSRRRTHIAPPVAAPSPAPAAPPQAETGGASLAEDIEAAYQRECRMLRDDVSRLTSERDALTKQRDNLQWQIGEFNSDHAAERDSAIDVIHDLLWTQGNRAKPADLAGLVSKLKNERDALAEKLASTGSNIDRGMIAVLDSLDKYDTERAVDLRATIKKSGRVDLDYAIWRLGYCLHELTAERDALRVQIEAALAREVPEHAWRKAWTLAIGCAIRRLELGGYNKITRNLISDIAPLPYEPPGAK